MECAGGCDVCSATPGTCTVLADAATGIGCGDYLCDGALGACPSDCTDHPDCATGHYCNASDECTDQLGASNACLEDAECLGGECEDLVCCSTACDGACDVCDATPGTCTDLAATEAGDPACAPFLCSGVDGSCATTCTLHTDCAATAWCDTSGDPDVCMPKKLDPLPCTDPEECVSGVCTENKCQPPKCGDGVKQEGTPEECDDGDNEPYDTCSPTCKLVTDHLIISEFQVGPTDGEFVEIYNPLPSTTANLTDVYIADYNTYYEITDGGAPSSQDYLLKFPDGTTLGPQSFLVVALHPAAAFAVIHPTADPPDFEVAPVDADGIPEMEGTFAAGSGLTNTAEMLVLFKWTSPATEVTDIDYVVWGNVNEGVDKTGLAAPHDGYLADTAVADQLKTAGPATNMSRQRCETSEGDESDTGGNGITGHDETSENMTQNFKSGTPTPGTATPAGLCDPP